MAWFQKIKNGISILRTNKLIPISISLFMVVLFASYQYSVSKDIQVKVYHKSDNVNFSDGQILDGGRGLYKRKELLITKKVQRVQNRINKLEDKIENLDISLDEIKEILLNNKSSDDKESNFTGENPNNEGNTQRGEVSFYSNENPPKSQVLDILRKKKKRASSPYGPSILSFPIKQASSKEVLGVKLPSGSFVKAKLLTGVEAINKPLPVLLQADYAFIGPNKSRIDLSGCFFIAKSTSNLSIERVEMQVTKISCVAKSGKMFERKLNAFVTDSKDNSFAVQGKVNSKQDRVATMAFLSSIVEGVGKAIQQAQTTTVTSEAGTSSMITGDQQKFIAAGGVSNAASQVTQWYLKHAQNLLPSIRVSSSKDVWLVVQDSVELPKWYFKKSPESNESGSFLFRTHLTDK